MPVNLCVRCGFSFDTSNGCEVCWDRRCLQDLWQAINKKSSYSNAIVTARLTHPDFDQLEPEWGL